MLYIDIDFACYKSFLFQYILLFLTYKRGFFFQREISRSFALGTMINSILITIEIHTKLSSKYVDILKSLGWKLEIYNQNDKQFNFISLPLCYRFH